MLTRDAALETVRSFVADVRSLGIPVSQAILFGSYARNEQREWSDIDVALIDDAFTGATFLDVRTFGRLLSGAYVDIEPHTFQTAYFEDGDPFTEEIKRTGIVVG